MALDILATAETIMALEGFLDKHRPQEEMRDKLDFGYSIENQSVVIFEIRPHWQRKGEKIECPIAKATWVNTQQVWKIFWMRADMKWHSYKPSAKVKKLGEFLAVVDEDSYGCFWG